MERKWDVVFTEDYIEVHDRFGSMVTWTKDEWKEDDEVPFYLANAIFRVAQGKKIIG